MHLPIVLNHARELTSDLARSAQPHAAVRVPAAKPAAQRHSPGTARRVAATALRRSADRLAPDLTTR